MAWRALDEEAHAALLAFDFAEVQLERRMLIQDRAVIGSIALHPPVRAIDRGCNAETSDAASDVASRMVALICFHSLDEHCRLDDLQSFVGDLDHLCSLQLMEDGPDRISRKIGEMS